MKEAYNKTLQKIKETKNMSAREWNEIAKKENLLSSESLKYIHQKNFRALCEEIRNN